MKKAIIYTCFFAAIQILVPSLITVAAGLFGYSATTDGGVSADNVNMLIIAATASSVVTLILFFAMRWVVVSRSYVQSRPWPALFWCGLAAVGAVIPSSYLQELMPDLPNIAEHEFDMILRSRWGYFAVGLLAPVSEELVFRGAILRALLGWTSRHWVAIGISGLLFALIHANPAQMPHAFLAGVLLGWLYYRTGSVVPGIVFHWVNNSIAYVAYNLYPDPSLKLADLFGSQLAVLEAVVFSLLILLPSLYQLNRWLRPAQ